MNDTMNKLPRITVAFNVALFLYCISSGLVLFLISDKAQNISLQGLVITSMVDLIRVIIVTLITAYFVREVWNRFVSTVFDVRNVNTNESIALVLLASVLTG